MGPDGTQIGPWGVWVPFGLFCFDLETVKPFSDFDNSAADFRIAGNGFLGCAWVAETRTGGPTLAYSCPLDPLYLCGNHGIRATSDTTHKPRVSRSIRDTATKPRLLVPTALYWLFVIEAVG